MIGTGTLFVLCLGAFVLYSILLLIENNRSKRVVFGSFRDFLDRILIAITDFIGSKLTYLGRYIIKLSWYYSIHRFLRFLLTVLVKSYDYLETLFLKNRDRAKVIKIEKRKLKVVNNHLDLMADHKASTALSEEGKKELLAKKLERG